MTSDPYIESNIGWNIVSLRVEVHRKTTSEPWRRPSMAGDGVLVRPKKEMNFYTTIFKGIRKSLSVVFVV